jgi:hypothetical protein
VKKFFKAIIKPDINRDYYSIDNVHKYAGQTIYVSKADGMREYSGRLKNNNGDRYYWIESCFSSIEEV